MMDYKEACKQNKPFLPQVVLVMVFIYHSNRMQTKTDALELLNSDPLNEILALWICLLS